MKVVIPQRLLSNRVLLILLFFFFFLSLVFFFRFLFSRLWLSVEREREGRRVRPLEEGRKGGYMVMV